MKLSEEAKKYASSLYNKDFMNLAKETEPTLRKIRASSNRMNPPISQINQFLRTSAEQEVKAMLNSYLKAYEKDRKIIDVEDETEILDEVRSRINKYVIWAESSDFPEFKLPSTGQLIPNITSHLRSQLERLLGEVKGEIDIFTSKMRMNEKMLKGSESEEYKVLKWIYDKANGQRDELVDLNNLLEENANYNEKELENISYYLEGEGFVELPYDNGLVVILTHKGIREIRNPTQLKKQSSTSPTFHIYGSVGNIGDNNIANFQQNFGAKPEDIISLLKQLQGHISEDNRQEGLALIESLEKEIKSEKPSEPTIKLFLKGIGNFVKDTGKDLFVEIGKKLITGEIQLPNQ